MGLNHYLGMFEVSNSEDILGIWEHDAGIS